MNDCNTFDLKPKGLMVDTGATSHIVTDIEKLKETDGTFKPQKHVVELADEARTTGIALKRGAAEVYLRDNEGCLMKQH